MKMPRPIDWPLGALPAIRVAGRFGHDDRHFAARYLAATHALHLYDYPGTIQLDGVTARFESGAVSLTPAGRVSRYHLPRPGRHWCVHFEPAQRSDRETIAMPPLFATGSHRKSVAERLARISRLHHTNHPAARAAASAALLELLLRLGMWHEAQPVGARTVEATSAIDRVIDLVQRRLDRPLTVPELAEAAGLSQNYLARRFRDRMGVAIPRYLLECRIEQARLLLTSTDLPVKTIAARVGLPDAQHFNKQFRRLTGVSPTAYRNARGTPG